MNESSVEHAKSPMQACMGMMEEMSTGTGKGICPMAAMCTGIMDKPGFWLLPMIPGAALILGGILIFIEPTILFWLIAGTSIIVGLMMLFFAIFLCRRAQ